MNRRRVHWDTCPPGFESECAYVSVPLDYRNPRGRDIDVLVSRRPAPVQPAGDQLWLIMGGPGNSAFYFSTLGILDQLADALPNTDVYAIEHRGVGNSSQLACPEQQSESSPGGVEVTTAEIPACVQALDEEYDGGLENFTVSNAARDIRRMLRLTRKHGQRQFVYGVSYGTYLVQRLLKLFPNAADGAILDSIVAPGKKLNEYDLQADPVVMRQAARCAASPVCSDKLGDDPWTTIRTIVDDLENGHCAALGLPGEQLSSILWTFVDHVKLRGMFFPLLYRLSRCESADIDAAGHALAYVQALTESEAPAELQGLDTLLLTFQLATTELVERPYDTDQLLAACEEAVFCPDLWALLHPYADHWPTYDAPLANSWPEFDIPILGFNGNMDVKTTIEGASRITDHIDGPHQNFYEFPDAPHFLLTTSPVTTPGAATCALQMMVDFMNDPMVPPSDGCLDQLMPFDPDGTPAQAELVFGTTDPWENPARPRRATAPAPNPAQWRRMAARLRHLELGRRM